jgi:predicted dehydrogenase
VNASLPSRTTTRRTFLKTTSAAVVGAGVWSSVSPAGAGSSPNEKLNIGIIGVNNRGRDNLSGVAGENIVALCDIDDNYLAAAAGEFPKAARFNDWRKLVEEKSIDAVVISTADHTHAAAAIAAMRNGKHVYCEKPLAHTVEEARLVRETYKKAGVVTQMGTQIHATDNYRRVVELVRAGVVGPIRKAHVWCGRTSGKVEALPGVESVPAHLH